MCRGWAAETRRCMSLETPCEPSVSGELLVRGLCRNAVLGLGVADGVYMWRSRGIDSGVFSRSLMLSAKNAVLYGQVDVLNGAHLDVLNGAQLVICCSGHTILQGVWGCAADCAQHRATAFQSITVRHGGQTRSMVAQMGSVQSPAGPDGMLPAGHLLQC